MNKKIKYIPCDEKSLIGANHTTGKLRSSKYADNKGIAISKKGSLRTKEEQEKKKNKNKAKIDLLIKKQF